MRIYVASSWRCERQPEVVRDLREAGHVVYDFKNPPHRQGGFAWAELDPTWQSWAAEGFREKLLEHPTASHGFLADLRALQWCDACLLVMPCGRSAHLELGWAAGRGKRTLVLLGRGGEPELMYLLADSICVDMDEVLAALREGER